MTAATAQLILSLLTLLLVGILIPVWKRLNTIQDNHLTHIHEEIHALVEKMDAHIAWHLNQPRD